MPKKKNTPSAPRQASSQAQHTSVQEATEPAHEYEERNMETAFSKTRNAQFSVFRFVILSMICIMAFFIRLYSVISYESVIHEFDPYFNFRSTKYLVREGILNFINYYDPLSWYPMGRHVSETVYPGLMVTAGFLHWLLNSLHLTIDIRNVCVLLAPFFACNTALATYFLTKETVDDEGAGLAAAAFVALVPGYMSRSVAGSYDNEAVAIFALVFTFYVWVKAVKTGSLFWSGLSAVAYFYMVAAWGGYIFIINLIPLHVLVLLLCGKYTDKLYIAYCTFYVLATVFSMQIPFVMFGPVQSGDHFPAFGIFGLLQLYGLFRYLRGLLETRVFAALVKGMVVLMLLSVVAVSLLAGFLFTGRIWAILNPATTHIPIISSVSEHQPIMWTSYVLDLHILIFLVPVGLFVLFQRVTEATAFTALYGITSLWFSSSMVRLILVLSPVACVLGGIAISRILRTFFVTEDTDDSTAEKQQQQPLTVQKKAFVTKDMSLVTVLGVSVLLYFYVLHCNWLTREAYSHPSIVLISRGNGQRVVFDDFREAYFWLRHNTDVNAKIMSWWDYGYQIAAMGNRTVIVDNNTRNNTHIAQVGTAFASTEKDAEPIIRLLGADYLLVIFGGVIGYSGDDINKFLWMVRIGGGVNPRIKEPDYFNSAGQYRIGSTASDTMKNCLMYKLCYYNFDLVHTTPNRGPGFDLVRHEEVGVKNIKFKYLEEAFTSKHWMVRIFRVLPPSNRGLSYDAIGRPRSAPKKKMNKASSSKPSTNKRPKVPSQRKA